MALPRSGLAGLPCEITPGNAMLCERCHASLGGKHVLAGGPGHGPPAEDVRVCMRDGLASVAACVEDDPVATAGDALRHRHPVRLGHYLGQQSTA